MALIDFLHARGLTGDPFGPRFRKTLCPATRAEVDDLYVKVDGFRTGLEKAAEWFNDKQIHDLPTDKPWHFLIHGRANAGRRSTLNYLLLELCELYDKLDPRRMNGPWQALRVIVRVKDDHFLCPVVTGLADLHDLMEEKRVRIEGDLKQDIEKYVLTCKHPTAERMYQTMFRRIRNTCRSAGFIPALALDEPRSYQQFRSVARVLKYAAVVFALTENQAYLNRFKEELSDGEFDGLDLELSDVTPADVEELVVKRWKQFGGEEPPFIQGSVIEPVFTENAMQLGLAIKILADTLNAVAEMWMDKGGPTQLVNADLQTLQGRALAVITRESRRARRR